MTIPPSMMTLLGMGFSVFSLSRSAGEGRGEGFSVELLLHAPSP